MTCVCQQTDYSCLCFVIFFAQKAAPDDVFGKVDAIVTGVGVDEDVVYSKSTSLQVCNRLTRKEDKVVVVLSEL